MLYRRKLLLALVEVCGGSLRVADCQAILAQFCERKNKNYYDFFPSLNGYYSLVLAHDKHRLTDLGLFEAQEAFCLGQREYPYIDQLRLEDQHLLQGIIAEPVLEQRYSLFSDHFSTEEEVFARWSLDTENNWEKRKEYALHEVFTSMNSLIQRAKSDERKSLATLKPREILDFIIEPDEREWKPQWREHLLQYNLFDRHEARGGETTQNWLAHTLAV